MKQVSVFLGNLRETLTETYRQWDTDAGPSPETIATTKWILFQVEVYTAWFLKHLAELQRQWWPDAPAPTIAPDQWPQHLGMQYVIDTIRDVTDLLAPDPSTAQPPEPSLVPLRNWLTRLRKGLEEGGAISPGLVGAILDEPGLSTLCDGFREAILLREVLQVAKEYGEFLRPISRGTN